MSGSFVIATCYMVAIRVILTLMASEPGPPIRPGARAMGIPCQPLNSPINSTACAPGA